MSDASPDPARQPAIGPETVPARLTELAELLGGETPRSQKVIRGLILGALAGAALAGTVAARRKGRPPRT